MKTATAYDNYDIQCHSYISFHCKYLDIDRYYYYTKPHEHNNSTCDLVVVTVKHFKFYVVVKFWVLLFLTKCKYEILVVMG